MAKAAAQANPFAVQPTITDEAPSYALPDSRDYAVPSVTDTENGYLDSPFGAYSPVLREFPGGTPDPMRLGDMPTRERRPAPASAPEQYYEPLDADKKERHSVEMQDTDGFTETQGPLRRFARNPREIPSTDLRPTGRMSPHRYIFTRPMWGGPMRNSGEHFSMADFRRDYPILGTQPVRTWRNTYRITPPPYDGDMIDKPADTVINIPDATILSPVPPMAHNRYRLV